MWARYDRYIKILWYGLITPIKIKWQLNIKEKRSETKEKKRNLKKI
jgi:hypothetical protein